MGERYDKTQTVAALINEDVEVINAAENPNQTPGSPTVCFSRSVELHEKVIGAFIEKYMFY